MPQQNAWNRPLFNFTCCGGRSDERTTEFTNPPVNQAEVDAEMQEMGYSKIF